MGTFFGTIISICCGHERAGNIQVSHTSEIWKTLEHMVKNYNAKYTMQWACSDDIWPLM
jgi:hypothetical protein